MKHIWLTKSYCTCSDCEFQCEDKKEMIRHCKKNKHNGEVTSQKALHFSKSK